MATSKGALYVYIAYVALVNEKTSNGPCGYCDVTWRDCALIKCDESKENIVQKYIIEQKKKSFESRETF